MPRKKMSASLVLAMGIALVFSLVTGPASAVTVANGCRNGVVPTDWTGINVDITGTAPATVVPGGSVTVSNITQTLALPGDLFLAGYRLGILQVGLNTVPGTVKDTFEGTNTTQGTQDTNTVNVSVTFTISDPTPTNKTSGDETATPATATNTFNDMTWTAGSSGTIDFAESNAVEPPTPTTGGIVITATIGGLLQVNFGCSPGTVVGSSPGTFTPGSAAPFASTTIQAGGGNNPPVANAGPDQTVDSSASVTLDGSASSDPDSDPLTYAWSQTSGPSVSLSGASTASPTFTAPTGPATLVFQLQVCDPSNACSTDSVTVNVNAPVVSTVDASMEAIINGPIRVAAGDKVTVAKVCNVGTGPLTLSDTDITSQAMLNGATVGNGTFDHLTTGTFTLSAGGCKRFRINYTFGSNGPVAGDSVVFTHTVSVAGDVNAANDSSSTAAQAAK